MRTTFLQKEHPLKSTDRNIATGRPETCEGVFAAFALRYAAIGLPVFPLRFRTKAPIREGGFHQATTDERQIAEWAKRYPRANIGLRTGKASGISVVDIDPAHGGVESEDALLCRGRAWPDTPIQRTRSGGWHILFAFCPDLVTGQNRLGPGIDFRGEGGYIVAAPSIVRDHVTGLEGRYTWLFWPKTGFAPVPDWVIDYLEAERDKREAAAVFRARNTVRVSSRLNAGNAGITRKRYCGKAAADLRRHAAELLCQREPGRGRLLFTACCWLAPFIRGGFISEATVRGDFEEACRANGLVAKNGIIDVRKTMTRAFQVSRDGLPKLSDRPRRVA